MPTLVVQMGHVDRRTGATGTSGEQVFARRVGPAVVAEFARRAPSWAVRVIWADEARARYAGDVFASIHCDGSTSPSARGASVGYQNASGRDIAQRWRAAYAAHGWSGGWRPDNYTAALKGFYGTRYAREQGNAAAFVIESGFLTNPENRASLTGPDGAARVARALADAVLGATRPTPVQEDDMYEQRDRDVAGDRHTQLANELTLQRGMVLAMGEKLGLLERVQSDYAAAVEKAVTVVAPTVQIDSGALATELLRQLGAGEG